MSNELFADRFAEISLTGPLVRIDLASFSVREKDADGKAQLEFRQRVVMPVDGFVQSFSLMAQVMQQLEKQGLVTRNPGPGEVRAATSGAVTAQSPNFK